MVLNYQNKKLQTLQILLDSVIINQNRVNKQKQEN